MGHSLGVLVSNRALIIPGCFSSVLDLAIARNIRLRGSRKVQLRVDMFNAPNSAIITGRLVLRTRTRTPRTIQVQLRFSF